MINNHNIDPTDTYAAYLTEDDSIFARQMGIVSGATALEMIANSDAPNRLSFVSLTALNYDSSLTF